MSRAPRQRRNKHVFPLILNMKKYVKNSSKYEKLYGHTRCEPRFMNNVYFRF